MRVLLLNLGFIHKKNLDGFRAMCAYVKATLTEVKELRVGMDEAWDLVWIPYGAIHPSSFPLARRIILGPHNFVFPDAPWTMSKIEDQRASYNCLSSWNRDAYLKLGGVAGLDLVCLPYPVDTDRFRYNATLKTHDCLLYTKLRSTEEIKYVYKVLANLGLNYKVIKYGSYTEEEYKEALDTCVFGVWVGRHESQGFALQEALSSDVPLVVWDVDSMGEEWMEGDKPVYVGDKGEIKATAAPFWDARCGILVNRENLKEGVRFMKENWPVYRARQFILQNLSVAACAARWGLA
jgi:glycosyltransferase involved in cell wall biosynthesis